MNRRTQRTVGRLLVGGVVLLALVGSADAGLFGKKQTPGERFETAMKQLADSCAKAKLRPGETGCDLLKLKPADPLATEEGRFAHTIKIPNPVPEDSGYKPGMTSQEYFDHLCKTEAGEFIYKTVEDVEGLYMMRPRKEATDFELEHLYALEDPYGHENWEATAPAPAFVHPGQYGFLEMPITDSREPDWRKKYVHSSLMVPPQPGANIQRYFGYDGRNQKSLQKEYDVNRKSRYGYTWRGITRPHDREMGIAGGELIVLDLEANEVLAVRRGYIRSGDVRKNLTGVWWLGGHVCKSDSTRLFRTVEYIAQLLHPVPTQNKETSHVTK